MLEVQGLNGVAYALCALCVKLALLLNQLHILYTCVIDVFNSFSGPRQGLSNSCHGEVIRSFINRACGATDSTGCAAITYTILVTACHI